MNGDNVNVTNLWILTRPYAQIVAGTPTAMSLDGNGVFHFSYTTARADGHGRSRTGSHTILSVPSAHYPNGYHVTVEGGHAVSAPNASQLVIASDGATTAISVTVTPLAHR